MSDFKEKGTGGFSNGDLLWDDEGNHYLVVKDGFHVMALIDRKVVSVRLNNVRNGVPYIVRDGLHVKVAPMPSPDEMEQQYEESLWNE